MRVTTISQTVCPRCKAPAQGDFKYCPECAYRLRPGAPLADETPRAGGHWGFLLGAFAVGLLVAGFFVGKQLMSESRVVDVAPTPDPYINRLRVIDIPDQLPPIPAGVATYGIVLVEDVPSVDEAIQGTWAEVAEDGGADFLENTLENPHGLGRWSRLVKALYERTASLVETRERAVPIETPALFAMRYEVTRGQYAEFLTEIAKKTQILARRPWVTALWRPGDDRHEIAYARGYITMWWQLVADHHRRELQRPVEPPAWLGAERPALTDAQAVLLLVPPRWVRVEPSGGLSWELPPDTENLPVTGISWWDAHMFAEWASVTLSMGLRLPTGAEWMRIFHGNHPAKPEDDFESVGSPGWRWPWGDEYDPHGCNNATRSILEKKPEGLRSVQQRYGWHDGKTVDGVLNMAGNAAEWVDNWSAEFPEGREDGPLRAQVNEFLPATEEFPEGRTIQTAYAAGGSYALGIMDCTVNPDRALDKRKREPDVGFRLVLSQLAR